MLESLPYKISMVTTATIILIGQSNFLPTFYDYKNHNGFAYSKVSNIQTNMLYRPHLNLSAQGSVWPLPIVGPFTRDDRIARVFVFGDDHSSTH